MLRHGCGLFRVGFVWLDVSFYGGREAIALGEDAQQNTTTSNCSFGTRVQCPMASLCVGPVSNLK